MDNRKSDYNNLILSLSTGPEKANRITLDPHHKLANHHPAPDEWSVAETIFHLSDIEPQYRARLKRMVMEDSPQVPAIWPSPIPDPLPPLEESLQKFHDERAITVDFLSSLQDETWKRQADHATLGTVTIHGQVQNLLSHDEENFYQVIDTLDANKKMEDIQQQR